MAFMTEKQYTEIISGVKKGALTYSVNDFQNKSDRTLTLGETEVGSIMHVFIMDGVLHSHLYTRKYGESYDPKSPGSYRTIRLLSGDIHPPALIPSGTALPSVTDSEFAEIMVDHFRTIRFNAWGKPASSVSLSEGQYEGLISEKD